MEKTRVNLPGNISLVDATRERWDMIVVGAGPAGAIAARETSRLGVRVLLVDASQFPRRKVCGCCLNGNALSALKAVGLEELPATLGGVPLTRVQLGTRQRTAQLSLRGISISRDAFDVALIQEAMRAGVQFLPGVRAKLLECDTSCRWIQLNDVRVSANVVIAADGLNGRLAAQHEGFDVPAKSNARIGAGTILDRAPKQYEAGCIYMAAGQGGYVGLVRVEGGKLDLAAAFDSDFIRDQQSLGAAAEMILNEAGFPAIPGLREATWRGTPALTRKPERIAGERWFAVGDASGYVEPFTGEGMAWAMSGAAALAPLAVRAAQQWLPEMQREWERVHARIIGRRQRLCHIVARTLRSPMLCSLAVRAAGFWPNLAGPIIRALNQPGLK